MKKMVLPLALTAMLCAGAAPAQEYPARPIEFIVPWAPGGGSDALMRVIANIAEDHLGQPLPIINMPGVGGTIGLIEAAQREPDGYTISQIHEGLPVAHHMGLTEINWDDFEPIALMTSSPQFVVVNAASPWQTFEEFAEHARENPGAIRMGVTMGGVPHLHAAMIEEAIGAQFSYVGYEGTGERIRALVGGNLDAAIGDVSSSLQFVENGDLRFLAHGGSGAIEETPDVPRFADLGHDLELTITRGIVLPKGAPEDVQAQLEEAMRLTAEDERFEPSIRNLGAEADFRGREEYRDYLEALEETVVRLVDQLEG